MPTNTFWEKLARIVIILAVPPVIIFGNVYWLLSPAYVDYELAGAPANSRLKPADKILAKKVVQYLQGNAERTSLKRMGARELSHLDDAKVLFGRVSTAQGMASAAFAAAAIYLAFLRRQRPLFIRSIGAGGALTLAIAAVIAVMALLDFGRFFTGFHSLFFTGDTWLFPPGSLLIRLFPISFWMAAARTVLILAAVESLILSVGLWLGRLQMADSR